MEYTSRRVLTSTWIEGEKLSQSKADNVAELVNVGVVSYLHQLLDIGSPSVTCCAMRASLGAGTRMLPSRDSSVPFAVLLPAIVSFWVDYTRAHLVDKPEHEPGVLRPRSKSLYMHKISMRIFCRALGCR